MITPPQEKPSENDDPNVHSATIPPLRTFLVRRRAVGAETRLEEILVLAHLIQISFNVLIFETLRYQAGELISCVHRAFHAWADVEEILTPTSLKAH